MPPTLVPSPRRAIPARDAALAALRRDAAGDLAAAGLGVLVCAAALGAWGGLGADYVGKALALFALGAALVWRALGAVDASGPSHPHARFGAANRVTLLRLSVLSLMAALLGEALPPAPPAQPASAAWAAWALVIVATLTALLDAVDGTLARRSGLASRFGAAFDMETDAAFVLVLSALVLQAGQAGAWVLIAGLMRYAFVAAAMVLPWLARPLAPSRRRQTVCVVQITALIVCLGPIVPRGLATAIAALSLLLLAWSFATDTLHLARHRHASPERSP